MALAQSIAQRRQADCRGDRPTSISRVPHGSAGLSTVIQGIVGKLPLLAAQDEMLLCLGLGLSL